MVENAAGATTGAFQVKPLCTKPTFSCARRRRLRSLASMLILMDWISPLSLSDVSRSGVGVAEGIMELVVAAAR